MGIGMKRSDLQARAERKLADAELLFASGSYSNAAYLSGYAVELGLKACIASQIVADTIPSTDILKKVLVHKFTDLVGLAGLLSQLKLLQQSNTHFAANWAIVAEWSPEMRYEDTDRLSAQQLIDAIKHPIHGVLEWIKIYW